MNIIKDTLREVLISLHLDLSQNLKYDRLTRIIIKRALKKGYNCIDIGCHKGEILNLMLKHSPQGQHYGFEPIPYLFKDLEIKYKNKATIFPYALSDSEGQATFQLVRNAPAYSGLRKRQYDVANPEIEEINVEMRRLDQVIPQNEKINFIKIDVEGAEFGVMKGAEELLKRNKPLVLFECGKGASEFYGTTPDMIYKFITNEIGLKIYTLNDYIKNKPALKESEFVGYFDSNTEYYFVAANNTIS